MSKAERMAVVFNEWARRYAEDVQKFEAILDASGKAVLDYGERAAIFFEEVERQLIEAGKLPSSIDG